MKKISIVLYVVLFAAVAVLFVLHFTGKSKGKSTTIHVSGKPGEGIAYVNIDTIVLNFNLATDRKNDLMAKQKSAEAELNSKGEAYQKGVNDYQDKVNKGLLTRSAAQQVEQALMQQQQELMNLRDKLQQDLMEEQQVMNRQVIDYITKFLEENKSEYNYQYILGKSFGSLILYSDEGLDITRPVLAALNKKYASEKK
ncbi:MAG: OmpH family outer membrane protein [Bacteroidales bacterium]|jgi:outer membrane protein